MLYDMTPIGSGTVGAMYQEVANFAELPVASTVNGKTYLVIATTGIIFINRKLAGLYKSDGTNWNYLGDVTSYVNTVGGTAGQVLAKIDSTDFNTQWVTPASGGGITGTLQQGSITSVTYKFPAGLYGGNGGTSTLTINRVYYYPLILLGTITPTKVGVSVTTGATGYLGMALYSAGTDGRPTTKLLDYGTVDTAVAADKEIVNSTPITAGTYFIAFRSTSACQLRAASIDAAWKAFLTGWASLTSVTGGYYGFTSTDSNPSSGMPTNPSAGTLEMAFYNATTCPLIYIK